MKPRVQTAQPQELDAIAALDKRCFARPWTRIQWAEELELPQAHVDLAVHASEVVGVACSRHVGEVAEVLRIATAPEVRRLGIGRDLLRVLLDRARAASCLQVELEVERTNGAAVGLYRSAGFAVVGVRRGYYRAPPDDALLMTLDLHGGQKDRAEPVDSGGPVA